MKLENKSKKKKIEVWTSHKADVEFSKEVRKLGYCEMCLRRPPEVALTCSHFWGRFTSATRYNFDNCDCICFRCHFEVEHAKQGFYREWKIKKIGIKKYKELEKMYYQKKTTRRDEIISFMKAIGQYET